MPYLEDGGLEKRKGFVKTKELCWRRRESKVNEDHGPRACAIIAVEKWGTPGSRKFNTMNSSYAGVLECTLQLHMNTVNSALTIYLPANPAGN